MMASDLVNAATSDKLPEVDWAKNIEICELVASDQRQAKNVIKAIKKRLGSKSSNAQLYAVMLLEMLMNNIGEAVHMQIIEAGLLPILVKIVKKKSDSPVRERIFLLLDATQTSLGGASGKFSQYYNAYYELVVGADMEEDEELEAKGDNYQLEMMRCLREVNVDRNTVGCNIWSLMMMQKAMKDHCIWVKIITASVALVLCSGSSRSPVPQRHFSLLQWQRFSLVQRQDFRPIQRQSFSPVPRQQLQSRTAASLSVVQRQQLKFFVAAA